MIINRYYLISTIICFLSVFANAQSENANKREVRGRKAWVIATSVPEGLETPLKVLAGKKISQVRIFRRQVDAPVRVIEDGVIRIVKETTNDEGELVYENLAVAKIPEGVRESLIVLVPKKKNNPADGLRFHTKVLNLSEFKGGDALYVNLTSKILAVKLEEKKSQVKPGGFVLMSVLGNRKSAGVEMAYYYQNSKTKKWMFLNGSKIPLYKSRRDICIFSIDPTTRQFDYRGISLIVPKQRAK